MLRIQGRATSSRPLSRSHRSLSLFRRKPVRGECHYTSVKACPASDSPRFHKTCWSAQRFDSSHNSYPSPCHEAKQITNEGYQMMMKASAVRGSSIPIFSLLSTCRLLHVLVPFLLSAPAILRSTSATTAQETTLPRGRKYDPFRGLSAPDESACSLTYKLNGLLG